LVIKLSSLFQNKVIAVLQIIYKVLVAGSANFNEQGNTSDTTIFAKPTVSMAKSVSEQNPSSSSLSTKNESLDPEKTIAGPIDGDTDVEKGEQTQPAPSAVLDWNGPNDPDNPMNWPRWKRHYHVIPPAIISFSA
jgi:hypothetical protein